MIGNQNQSIATTETRRHSAAEPQPKTYHGDTEALRNTEKEHNLPAMREKIGFSESAGKFKSLFRKEHGEKAEVTEKYIERTGNATKLGLIFFAIKEESCG